MNLSYSPAKRYLGVCLHCGRGMSRSDFVDGLARHDDHIDPEDRYRFGDHSPIADEATIREVGDAEYASATGRELR